MASEIQDLGERMYRVGCLQGKLEVNTKRLEAIENELKQMEKERDDIRQEMEKERDDIRQELEDTLWQVRRTNDTTDS